MGPSPIMMLIPARGAPGPAAASWGVQFSLQGDRLSHWLFADDPAGRQTVMRSVEGDDSERWPPSPALQQIALGPGSARPQTLACVGSAGTAHWSMAVEEDDRGCLVFDLACRVKEPFSFLGSTYQVADLATEPDRQPAALAWTLPDGRRWFVQPEDATSQLRWLPERQQWTVEPGPSQVVGPTTIRWKYRIGHLPASTPPA